MESRLDFPFVTMPVDSRYAGATQIYQNKRQFRNLFRDVGNFKKRGLQAEIMETMASSRISQIRVEVQNQTSALATYTYYPYGDKTPYQMTTILRKGATG